MTQNLLNQTFVVIDVATTGFRVDADEPVEIAAVRTRNGEIIEHAVWRVCPSVKIPPSASAVHELRDRDVQGCPTLAEVEDKIKAFVGNDPIVMHNLSLGEPLDKAMLPFLHDNQWVCNARLTKHIWPQMTEKHDFPLANYDVWTLNYWLNEPGFTSLNAQVYEPLANASATAHVFKHAIQAYLDAGHEPSIQALSEFSEQPVAFNLMPRGKYKNCLMSEIPVDDLKFELSRIRKTEASDSLDRDFVHTIEQEADRRLRARGVTSGLRR